MKVAYVLATSGGGTLRHVRMLAGGLAGRGVAVSVYGPASTWEGDGTGRPPSGGPAFAAVEIGATPRPGRDLAAVRRLRRLLAGSRPDIVHAHGLRAGAIAALAVRAGSRPPWLIVTAHNAPPPGTAARCIHQLLERITARRADAVLCVSADLESRMRRRGARAVARAVVAAPPAPPHVSAETLASLRAELGVSGEPPSPPVVLAAGRLAPQKGLAVLVRAAGTWRHRDPVPLLAIAGDGPLAGRLARQAAAGGVLARFLGHRGDVPALLAAADVVVVPSLWEGQPLIVQEALRAGRPLVASRAGGIPGLTGEDAALLVPPADAGALSAAVLAVLDNPALAARLSQAALDRAAALPAEQDALDAAAAAYARVSAGPG